MFSLAIAVSDIRPDIDAEQFVAAVVVGCEVAARWQWRYNPNCTTSYDSTPPQPAAFSVPR